MPFTTLFYTFLIKIGQSITTRFFFTALDSSGLLWTPLDSSGLLWTPLDTLIHLNFVRLTNRVRFDIKSLLRNDAREEGALKVSDTDADVSWEEDGIADHDKGKNRKDKKLDETRHAFWPK